MSEDVVLVVGDVMTDIIVVPEGTLVRGSDRRARIRMVHGGSAANQAVWLAQFGVGTRFAARVGSADKPALDAYFGNRGIEPRLVGDPVLPSGILINIVDPDGERSFLTDRGANLALSPDDLPERLLEGASWLVLSGYSFFAEGPRVAVIALMAAARRRGCRIAVDPASEGFLREAGIRNFLDWTAGADVLFANYDEAFALSGVADVGEQTRVLAETYRRVVIKRGALGASIGNRDGVAASVGAAQIEVVDTTGAGDAFLAGFLAAELRGEGESTCLAAAIEAGGRAVSRIGAQPG